MVGPNKENIEQWLFEWNEGNLSASEESALESFLIKHPEFDIDKEAWSLAKVQDVPPAVFQNKGALTKKKRAIYPIAAAASFLLLLGSSATYFYLKNQSDLEMNLLNGDLASLSNFENLNSDLNQIYISDIHSLNSKSNSEETNNLNQFNVGYSNDNNAHLSINSLDIPAKSNVRQATLNATTKKVESTSDVSNFGTSEVFANDLTETEIDLLDFDNLEIGSNELNTFNIEAFDSKTEETNELAKNKNQEEDIASASEVSRKKSSREFKSKFSKFKQFMVKLKNSMNRGNGLINLRESDLAIAGYNHLDFNPAFAGNKLNFTTQTQGYGRWLNTKDQLIAMNASVDGYIHGMRGSIGMKVNYENFGAGMYQNANAQLIYSPKIFVNKKFSIEPAVKFTMGQRWMNENKITSGSNIELERGNLLQTFNTNESPFGNKVIYKDLGLGINFNTKWFYANFSADQILRHKTGIFSNNSSDRASVNLTASIGTNYQSRNKKWALSPFIAYQKRNAVHEIWGGTGVRWNWITFGTGISNKLDFVANAGVKLKGFQLFYQFEMLESTTRDKKINAHQLTLRYSTKPSKGAKRVVNL